MLASLQGRRFALVFAHTMMILMMINDRCFYARISVRALALH